MRSMPVLWLTLLMNLELSIPHFCIPYCHNTCTTCADQPLRVFGRTRHSGGAQAARRRLRRGRFLSLPALLPRGRRAPRAHSTSIAIVHL